MRTCSTDVSEGSVFAYTAKLSAFSSGGFQTFLSPWLKVRTVCDVSFVGEKLGLAGSETGLESDGSGMAVIYGVTLTCLVSLGLCFVHWEIERQTERCIPIFPRRAR